MSWIIGIPVEGRCEMCVGGDEGGRPGGGGGHCTNHLQNFVYDQLCVLCVPLYWGESGNVMNDQLCVSLYWGEGLWERNERPVVCSSEIKKHEH